MHRPATAVFALTAIGTPANGRGSLGSIASASASAASPSSSTNAPSCGSIASIRRSAASTASRAVNEPSRTRAASSVAGRNASASMETRGHYADPAAVWEKLTTQSARDARSPVRPRGRRRVRDRDRRARQGGRGAALSRRRHLEQRARVGVGVRLLVMTATNGIEVAGLVREFKNGPRAVDGIDLEVAPGEIYGFLGPNGAGKSTTVLMLTTLLPPTAGTARVAGYDIVKQGPQVRASIGAALQEAALDQFL